MVPFNNELSQLTFLSHHHSPTHHPLSRPSTTLAAQFSTIPVVLMVGSSWHEELEVWVGSLPDPHQHLHLAPMLGYKLSSLRDDLQHSKGKRRCQYQLSPHLPSWHGLLRIPPLGICAGWGGSGTSKNSIFIKRRAGAGSVCTLLPQRVIGGRSLPILQGAVACNTLNA